jgi:hypothetical protein
MHRSHALLWAPSKQLSLVLVRPTGQRYRGLGWQTDYLSIRFPDNYCFASVASVMKELTLLQLLPW